MKFWFLLLVLGWRMAWLGRNSEDFQRQLKDKELTLQFRTENGKVARYYTFSGERVRATPGLATSPTMTLSFRDAAYAYDTIMAAARNPGVFMQGMQQQAIKASGDMGMLMWFMGIIRFLPPKKKSKS